jgi:hypothetical protein
MFKAIKVDRLDASAFNRSEQNTEAAFAGLADNGELPITKVKASTSVSSYIVKPQDLFIVVDSSAATIKIVLPAAPGPAQAVSIKNRVGRPITIVQSNGKAFDGVTSITLNVGKSTQMVNTGTEWTEFNGRT